MRKLILPLLVFSILFGVTPSGLASAPKAGSSCAKFGDIQNQGGKKFTCVKSGKKMVWNQGVSTPTPTPTPTPTTSMAPLETTYRVEISSTSPAPGRFCSQENSQSRFGNEYLTCKKGVWARKLGLRVDGSTSPTSTYSPKYGKVTEKELEKNILANWAEWKQRKKSNTPKITVVLQDGYSKDWENVTREVNTYVSNILDGNGLKLVQVPYWVFGETEEFRVAAFNDFAKAASCHPPYMANMEEVIYCSTADIGSGGLRISKPGVLVANNYRLTQKDILRLTNFVASDLAIFYVVQAQYGDVAYTGIKYQIPSWIRAGATQLIGLLATNDLRNSGKSYVDLKGEDVFVGPRPESICSKDLQDAEGKEKMMPDQCSQSMSLYAVSLLVAKFGGLDALFKFLRLYGLNDDWVSDFKEAFGISREDFYKEWWAYQGIQKSDWPDIQLPTAPERY
jgi:hypothetical protein